MKRPSGSILIMALLCLGILFALPVQGAPVDHMPKFALPSVTDGKIVNSDEYKGKILLINFFATWCPPCRQEMPHLQKMHDKYGPEGFAVLAISVDDGGPRIVNKLVQKMGLTYPVVLADDKVSFDFGGIIGIPTTFLVNREGRILKRFDGYIPHDIVEKELKKVFGPEK